jgi:threonine dehydratase
MGLDRQALLARIDEARRVLDRVIVRTPLLPFGPGTWLKAESLQKTGSFKFRGAYFAIARLPERTRAAGVVAYSTGNHAQSVALAAREFGVPASIVMSESAPPEKVARTRAAGAEVVMAEDSSAARKARAEELAAARGCGLVPPYEHLDVIAAQGTIAAEILDALPDCAALFVPVGGGGLISGIALYAKARRPRIRVVGVEPAGAADARESLLARELRAWTKVETVCDGLSVAQLGRTNFELILELVDEIVAVEDAATLAAMRRLLFDHKLLVEPSGAIAAAALDAARAQASPAVAVLSGGNVAPSRVAELLAAGT